MPFAHGFTSRVLYVQGYACERSLGLRAAHNYHHLLKDWARGSLGSSHPLSPDFLHRSEKAFEILNVFVSQHRCCCVF